MSKHLPALKLITAMFIFQSDSAPYCTCSPWECRVQLQTPHTEQDTLDFYNSAPIPRFCKILLIFSLKYKTVRKRRKLILRKGAQKKRYPRMQAK